MPVFLYARVSTAEQTIDHQLAHATAAGFRVDEVVWDNGSSGVATRLSERPQGRRLFDMLRASDTLVVRWVDRLGRNYEDVCDTIREFMRRGVVVRTVINNFTFDGATKDPMQQAVRDALIGFMAATAQAQAEASKAAQRAGIEYAKQKGDRAYLGRYVRDRLLYLRDHLRVGRYAGGLGLLQEFGDFLLGIHERGVRFGRALEQYHNLAELFLRGGRGRNDELGDADLVLRD